MSTPEIGVENLSGNLDTRELAFAVEACNTQIWRDIAPAWAREPVPVVFYEANKVPDGAYPIALKDMVPEGELGDHGYFDGKVAGSVLADDNFDLILSHECGETFIDPHVDQYINDVAEEIMDPVQTQWYEIEAELFGEKRTRRVSNFVLPNYFISNSEGPWDFLHKLSGPLTIAPGGYLITRNGNRFPAGSTTDSLRLIARKLANPRSRLHRRLMKMHG